MTFGEQNSFQQSCELLDEAIAAGINFIDAAEMGVLLYLLYILS